jgi:hypothetical protein
VNPWRLKIFDEVTMSSKHDYQLDAEPDISGAANRHIWYYFIALGVMLAVTLIGLTIMYRFELDYEKTAKVGHVDTQEARDYVDLSESYIKGKRGLFEGKRHVPIDDAMARFLTDVRQGQ